jgi:hypothetical protein
MKRLNHKGFTGIELAVVIFGATLLAVCIGAMAAGTSHGMMQDEFDGRCPICKAQGLVSKIYFKDIADSEATCVKSRKADPGHFDEKGIYRESVSAACLLYKRTIRCSQGHDFELITEQRHLPWWWFDIEINRTMRKKP